MKPSEKKSKITEMESLPDPLKDRQIKDIPPPVQKPLSTEYVFTGTFFNIY